MRPVAKKYGEYLAELREQKFAQKQEEESPVLSMNEPSQNETPIPNNKSMSKFSDDAIS